MKVRYSLEAAGRVVYELIGDVDSGEDLDKLSKAFWSKIRLPWGGSTVSVRVVG